MRMREEREAVIAYSRRMAGDGLAVGTSGNVSVRAGDLIAITPTGVAYDDLTAADVCLVDLDGEPVEARLRPSSEVPMHTAVYAATDAGAVVHTHPLHATALSLLVDELPGVHYLIALLGGPVRVVPYAPYGTEELARLGVEGLADRTAVILANHGATTYGAHLEQAYTRSIYLEWLCRLWAQARTLGEPRLLDADQLEAARVAFGGYGQR
ncbi:class II aldolase/adducin family protein [Actinomycetospora lutea]|nr:class II aldolase/adducin family protein [Actinomycetospora lutea]MDD7938345.1 class II aldolase/adducin family protein [Actinomycetospora lutea]